MGAWGTHSFLFLVFTKHIDDHSLHPYFCLLIVVWWQLGQIWALPLTLDLAINYEVVVMTHMQGTGSE